MYNVKVKYNDKWFSLRDYRMNQPDEEYYLSRGFDPCSGSGELIDEDILKCLPIVLIQVDPRTETKTVVELFFNSMANYLNCTRDGLKRAIKKGKTDKDFRYQGVLEIPKAINKIMWEQVLSDSHHDTPVSTDKAWLNEILFVPFTSKDSNKKTTFDVYKDGDYIMTGKYKDIIRELNIPAYALDRLVNDGGWVRPNKWDCYELVEVIDDE